MLSQSKKDKTGASSKTRRLTLLAILLGNALIASFIERSIPFNFAVPGVKLGLANVVTLFALYKFKPGDVFVLVILKCIMTSIFIASFSALAYSVCGSLLSFAAMTLILKTGRNLFSPVGVSVVGAICHNIGQILAASFMLGSLLAVAYLPALLISGVITGVLVGLVVKMLLWYTASAFK